MMKVYQILFVPLPCQSDLYLISNYCTKYGKISDMAKFWVTFVAQGFKK